MEIFGLTITRTKKALATVNPSRGGWYPIWSTVRESYTGAWQANAEIRTETVVTNPVVYACVTLLAADVGKMRVKLVEEDANGIWVERDENSPFLPVLRRPNPWQNRIQFFKWWVTRRLIDGNFYAIKSRDARGVVNGLYPVEASRVVPLVSEDGAVFYQIRSNGDRLARLPEETVTVPAREMLHDPHEPLWHPLVGVSPLVACGLAAQQGLNIQTNSSSFFANGSNPGGVLSAPGAISAETAQRLKDYWETNYSGNNVGKIAVLGDGLKFEQMAIRAVDAQLVEQLKWLTDAICAAFHVPPYKVNLVPAPPYGNTEAVDQQYYSNGVGNLIESIEAVLDDAIEVPARYGTEFDIDGLIRMDTPTKVKAAVDSIGGSLVSVNEARRKFDLPPVEGGDSPMSQQQNFSLAALAERDRNEPFAKPATPPPASPANAPSDMPPEDMPEDMPAQKDAARRAPTWFPEFERRLRVKRAERRSHRVA